MIPIFLAAAIWTNVSIGLTFLALLLAILALVRPAQQHPLVAVAVLLLAVALLAGSAARL